MRAKFTPYRPYTGTWAWFIHRLTGIGLAVYLPMHVYVTSSFGKGEKAFMEQMGFIQMPLFRWLEIGLLFAVLFHVLNGIRVTLVDLGWGLRQERVLFWVLMAIGAVLFVAGIPPLLPDDVVFLKHFKAYGF